MTEELTNRLAHRSLLAIFAVLVVAICLGGYRFYSTQREAVEREVTNELQVIADLKAEQIVEWRRERLSDARVILSDPALIRALHSVVAGRASSGKKQELLQWLEGFRKAYRYSNAVLLDSKGKEVLRQGQVYGGSAHFRAILAEIETTNAAMLRDLHTEKGGEYHLGLNLPLRLPGDNVLFGMLSFAINPEEHLFPMVDRWPGPRRVGETLLARRNGEEALYLDNRDSKTSAGSRTGVGLNKREAIAVKALHGESGLVRGTDRQGRQVAAAVCAIPNSQWLVIAQIPLEAIDNPIRDRALPISLAVISLILASGMASAYLWRLQEQRHDEARRGAEVEKQALATHYNFLSRSANDAILLVNENGSIVETNEHAVEMYGYSREELLGMSIATLRAKECQDSFEERWRQVLEQPSALFETVHARRDGHIFPVEISALAITVEGRVYNQAIIRDITQRNLVTKQLENANRLYAVLSQCNQALLHEGKRQEMFEAVCQAAVQEGGFPLAMIVRLDRETGDVPPVAAAGEAQEYARGIRLSARLDRVGMGVTGIALRSGETAVVDDFESDHRQKPWRERALQMGLRSSITAPIQRSGQVEFGFVLYSRDLAFFNHREVKLIEEVAANISYALRRMDEEAGRKAAEEALRHGEERYRHLVENAPVGMYVHTGGIVRYMNAKGMEMLGFTSLDELGGKNINSFIHPGDREMIWERIRILDAGGACPLIEERFVRANGSTLHVEVSAVPTVFEEERSTFVFFIDVTQRKTAEEERARMEEQFLQAQKMESVGRLAGGVAHDFNNNLTVINGYCDLLLSSLAEGDPARRDIAYIRKAGDQASKLTRQLLTFSRRQVFSPRRVNLNELVTEAKSLLGRLIGDHIRIQPRLAPGQPSVLADPTQLHQVLMNLAINARDAMPEGGDLIIATSNVHLGEEQAARTIGARPGEFVVLTVADTGMGMDAETKRHIFEPFFTTKPRGAGTGLGLATVYGIVQQSNGWVEVESAPGAGTTFQIILPAVAGAATQEEEISGKADPGHGTILLVEDRSDVRLLTLTILKSLGYSVLEAESAGSALKAAEACEYRIDLLLTDVVMPGMSGTELAKRLRDLRPSTKVLFMSGYTEDERFASAGSGGKSQLLAKPFTPSALAAKVREVLGR